MSQLQLRRLQTPLLGPIDLYVGAGECVCLSGPSGSGKSLLLRAAADLDPHDGEAFLEDVACSEFTATEWRRRVGLLAADSQWWRPTVGEHFPAGCDPDLNALGFLPETLGWSVERLSTGERQRLALLRLLCNEPQALLLDEPTANLDAESTLRAEQLIGDYSRRHQAAVLWVSHDAAQIRRVADRVLRLEGGVVHEARAA
ncbi:MAG: ATP-binding cassette domain-containing protein [Gammaproteobacteria bacterium]